MTIHLGSASTSPRARDPGKPDSVQRFSRGTLRTADGTLIGVREYAVPLGGPPARQRLLIAGATGVPQAFYRRFAEYAAERGFATLTLDYRGIGESRPASLRGFKVHYLDWARQDLAAAVLHWHDPAQPLFMLGHSFGGHAFGLLPEPDRISRFYTFATGAGWHGWMPTGEQWRVLAMWHVMGPVLTRWRGYLPWSMLGMGEDLPLGVYRDWKRWCQYPRYFFDDDVEGARLAADFARVTTPIVAANALDDRWAPPRSRNAFMAGYSHAPVQMVDIDPSRFAGGIGHMGYFRAPAEPLWQAALDWFAQDPWLKHPG